MMSLDERLFSLIFGLLLGFALGYITRSLKEVKEKVDEVDHIVKQGRSPEESGFVRYPLVADVALLLVVCMTVWASFASQRASNELEDTQNRLSKVTLCNQQFLSGTIEALNQRTTYTGDQARANVELQKAQAEYLSVVLEEPPSTDGDRAEALSLYFEKLTEYVNVNAQNERKQDSYPYPTNEQLSSCLDHAGASKE